MGKYTLLFLLIFQIFTFKKKPENPVNPPHGIIVEKENTCVLPVRKFPKYKHGSNKDLIEILKSKIQYPTDSCIEGVIILSFVVNKNGKVEQPLIYRSLSKEIEDLLIEEIRKYEFVPGKIQGEIKECRISLPIRIALS